MMTPTVTDGATMIAAPAETPQASTAFSSWLNNAMQQHGAQTAAHGADVDADIDTDLEGDTSAAAEDELLAIIEQLNGMLSGNQVSATSVGSVASASAPTEDGVVAVTSDTQLDSDAAIDGIVSLELNGEMVDGQGGSAANAEPTMPMSPTVTAATAPAVPAATPSAVEGVAPTEALQSLDVVPAASPTADAVQANDITVQATPELVDNNDVKPLIRLDAAAPTASTSQITPAVSQSSASTDVDGLAQLVTSHAQKASQTGTSSRLSITLRPDDLGTVQLEIRAGANGLEIATATTHESGRAAIESVIPEIRAMAQQSGLRISEIQVGTNSLSDNLADLQQHGDRRDNHQQPERHRRTSEAANMTRTVNLTDGHIGQVNVEV
ncbi:MAG: flagellar hook-length control protein FliK [Ilumatobacteraceae bacterium]